MLHSNLPVMTEPLSRQPQSEFPLEQTHEFRSSLNTIFMSLELLKDDSIDEEERQSYLNFIRAAAEQMKTILDQAR
jgi:signal transduction histidine kinase